ncbi:hypothetical protein G9A89_011889 [Geosiphon pyriformis]|nr:hypothetical protein G9A89_011889 [Geosiphon pyriformis]
MDGSLKGLGSVDVVGSAAAFFLKIDLGIGIRVVKCLSSIMTELQTVALALECVLFFCSVVICLNSQTALNAYVLELRLSGVLDNVCTNALAREAAYSSLLLPTNAYECFIVANGLLVSGNVCYFV